MLANRIEHKSRKFEMSMKTVQFYIEMSTDMLLFYIEMSI